LDQDDQHHRAREKVEVHEPIKRRIQIVADKLRLKRAMLNLLRNAIGYTPKVGEVSVLVTDRGEAGVKVSVKDNGFGIPRKLVHILKSPSRVSAAAEVLLASGDRIGLTFARSFIEPHSRK